VQACDILLTRAQRKKQSLVRRRRNLGESIDKFRKRMGQIGHESVVVQLSLEAFTTAYEMLPEGKDNADMKVKIKRLELRQALLEKKAYTCNVASLLVKELKYNQLDSQVSAMEDYIAAVEHLKTILAGVARHGRQAAAALRLPVSRQMTPLEEERFQTDVFALPIRRSKRPEESESSFHIPDHSDGAEVASAHWFQPDMSAGGR